MRNFSLVRAGVIVNVILADQAFITEHGPNVATAHGGGEFVELTDAHLVDGQRPGPGWTFDPKGARQFARPAGA
jgi:hypothetical protein